MLADPAWPESFHGEQVAVATLTMARLQEDMLAGPAPILRAPRPSASDFDRRFGPETGPSCWREFVKKRLADGAADGLNERLAAEWSAIAEEISEVAVPAGHLRETLRKVGAPTAAADLALPGSFYRDAVIHAREIRDRFTFLDLAADSGRFDDGFEP